MIRNVLRWVAPVAVLCSISAYGLRDASATKQLATSPVRSSAGAAPFESPAKGKLISTRLTAGYSGAESTGGWVAVGPPQTMSCPATKAPCAVVAIIQTDFDSGANVGGPGPWSLCLEVDGTVDSSCAYAGIGADDNYFTSSTQIGSTSALAAGNHTVQSKLFTTNATKVYYYHVIYQMFV